MPYACRVVTFVVEAYLSASHRLLWRATEEDRSAAYWLALRAEADPRLEVRVIELRDGEEPAVEPPPPRTLKVVEPDGERPTERPPIVLPRSAVVPKRDRPKHWLACRTD